METFKYSHGQAHYKRALSWAIGNCCASNTYTIIYFMIFIIGFMHVVFFFFYYVYARMHAYNDNNNLHLIDTNDQ